MSADSKVRPIDRRGDWISRGEVVDRVNAVVGSLNELAAATGAQMGELWAAHNDQAAIVSKLAVEVDDNHTALVRRIHALEQRALGARWRQLRHAIAGAFDRSRQNVLEGIAAVGEAIDNAERES